MSWPRVVVARVRALFVQDRLERELDHEVRFHLDMQVEDHVRAGMDPVEARHAALRSFGGAEPMKEQYRARRAIPMLDTLTQDVRYGLRTLRRSPGFTATALLSLALGIGANTAIFSLIDALMLRWLPVRDPQQLVEVMMRLGANPPTDSFSYPVVRALATHDEIFSGLCGFSSALFNVGPPDAVERTSGAWVSGAFYETLGLEPVQGRLLTRADDEPGAAPVAVITDAYWARRFGRDPHVIGQTMSVEGVDVTVVGVSPPGFTGATVGQMADLTLPLAVLPQVLPERAAQLEAGSQWLRVLARPHLGVPDAQTNARLAVLWPTLVNVAVTSAMPPARRQSLLSSTLDLVPGGTGWTTLRDQFRQPLLVLMAVVGLVLLIACANVANLLLARAATREREIAVRLAIGAGRGRIIRQLLTESVLLSALGAVVAMVLAAWAGRFLVDLLGSGRMGAIAFDLTPNAHVLGFTSLMAMGTAMLFGLVPALRATAAGPAPVLKKGRSGTRSGNRLASALVMAQVSLSLLLLIAAGLFVRTLQNLQHLDPGFQHAGVLLVDVDGRRAGYRGDKLTSAYQELLQRAVAVPGVRSASLSGNTPLSGGILTTQVAINGQAERGSADVTQVSPRYFETLHMPLILGRDFTLRDDTSVPGVAIVNQAFVARYFPDGHPLGQHVSVLLPDLQIVGVVKDAVSWSFRTAPRPGVYLSCFQSQPQFTTFELDATGSLTQVASAVRRAFQPRLPGAPVQIRTLTAQVESALVQERLMATLAGSFGTLALVLATVGLYGLLAYTVARRTNEIGIRMALGAERRQVVWLVIRDAVQLLAIGVGLGLPVAWAASRFVSAMLFGLTATDPPTMLAATLLLAVVGLSAGALPAWRASRVDPMVALRYE